MAYTYRKDLDGPAYCFTLISAFPTCMCILTTCSQSVFASCILSTTSCCLLSAQTTVRKKWLPVETFCDYAACRNETVSAGSHLSCTTAWSGSKWSRTVSAKAKYDGQSLHEVKIGRLVYTMCLTLLHSERPKLYTILAFLTAIGLD